MSDTQIRELERRVESGDTEAREQLYNAKRRSGILPSWDELRHHFAHIIALAEGPTKGKSGIINIRVDSCVSDADVIYVELGTYDIGSWPSWVELSGFKTFEEAQAAVADKLDEALAEVHRELREDDSVLCSGCDTRLGGYKQEVGEQYWEDYYCTSCAYLYFVCEDCGVVYDDANTATECCISLSVKTDYSLGWDNVSDNIS